MTRRLLLPPALLLLLLLFTSAASAGELDQAVRSRWLGAWVLTDIETWSSCNGAATNNRVNGSLVKSRGAHRFLLGELAKVTRIEAKKSRVDLHLALAEPFLVPRQEGPFTLYDEARCRVELEVMLERTTIKGKAIGTIDETLAGILERYATERSARASGSWNRREAAWPEDYEATLAEHAAWLAEQTNERVQAKLDRAVETTRSVTSRMSGDLDYLSGFARGVEEARQKELRGCESMLAVDLNPAPPYRTRGSTEPVSSEKLADRGHRDGRRLVLGLELMDRLPRCFVSVPSDRTASAGADGSRNAATVASR